MYNSSLNCNFLVAQEKDFYDGTLGFHPEFTHQVFGEK